MTKADGRGSASDGGAMKKTQGRRKIAMKIIEKENARQVCFSKRRKGLVKKASGLAVKCDAQVLVVVFSPAGRPYTFGSPSVPVVVDRFLNPSAYDAEAAAAATRRVQKECGRLKLKAEGLTKHLEEVGHWRMALDKAVRAACVWIDGDVKQWRLPLLEAALAALEMVQAVAAERTYEMTYAPQAMIQRTGGAGGGSLLHCLGSGSSTSDSTGSHEVMAIDTTLRLMGGGGGGTFVDHLGSGNAGHALAPMQNVGHALAPMMQPPPRAPLALPFNNGLGFNHLSMGYGHNQPDGHAAFYGTEGGYGPACSFFG